VRVLFAGALIVTDKETPDNGQSQRSVHRRLRA
jgi:hypothetical protein